MAHLGNTIVNGALRVLGGENVDTINGVTVGASPKFTDTNNKVTQTATTANAAYEVLFSETADNTTRTEGSKKAATLRFNPASAALMQGTATVASGFNSHAEGYQTTASGNQSHAEGHQTIVSGDYSHAEGIATQAIGDSSHAEGYCTTASGAGAHAEGGNYNDTVSYRGTLASGRSSHAEGTDTKATGNFSHAEGWSPRAVGIASHAEGEDTTALGECSHAEGQHTSAAGKSAHAEGFNTKASDYATHAEGRGSIASIADSHAEGYYTTASGSASHAEGHQTIASGDFSHASGQGTSAGGVCQTVIGKYNVADTDSLFIIGNGSSSARSNALRIDSSGNFYTNKLMLVGKESSRSTSTVGTWTAMCRSDQTGSPTLPIANKWYNVISLNNWTDSSTNWVSQLAICTQDNIDGVWWRTNDSAGTDISSSTWYHLIDNRYFENYGCKLTVGNSAAVSSDISMLHLDSYYVNGAQTTLIISPSHGYIYTNYNNYTNFWAIHSGNAYTTDAVRDAASVNTNGFYWINTNAPSPANNDVFAPDNTVMLIASAYNENWVDEIAQDSYNHGVLLTRSKQNGAWTNWYNTYYGCKWTCYVVCNSWRKLFISNVKNGIEGQSGILSISTTRNGVVLNGTFLITVNHYNSGYFSCKQLGGSNYQSGGDMRIRIFSDTQANFYVEILDSLAGSTTSTGTYYHCSYLALLDSNDIITYTTAPAGGALEGYSSSAELRFNYSAQWSNAEGCDTRAIGSYDHSEGWGTSAAGSYSHAEGYCSTASAPGAHAEGYGSYTGSGQACGYSHAEGQYTYCGAQYSHAEGGRTSAVYARAHAEGEYTCASGDDTHAEGVHTTASVSYSHAEGYLTWARNTAAHASGFYTRTASAYSAAMGKYNTYSDTNLAFIIGNGAGDNARSNAFSVTWAGVVKASSTITASTAADYAEYFEWKDLNINAEDRVGYFVTFDSDDKIRIATNEDDYILGIVSGQPFVLGNGDCDVWNGIYLRDKFRRTIYEPAPAYEITNEGKKMIPKIDKNGKRVYEGTQPKLNPDYDPSQPYINRADRPEWAPIGMLGVLAVRDDGTCEVNKYCTVNENGIATKWYQGALTKYRVIRRNDVDVVEVVFR